LILVVVVGLYVFTAFAIAIRRRPVLEMLQGGTVNKMNSYSRF